MQHLVLQRADIEWSIIVAVLLCVGIDYAAPYSHVLQVQNAAPNLAFDFMCCGCDINISMYAADET